MPGVTIEYRSVMTVRIADTIKFAIRDFGVRRLSTTEVTLKPEDFTLIFQDAGPFSEMSHDIIVRIPLHNFPERVEVGSDALAEGLGSFIRDALQERKLCGGLRIGVSVPLCDIGWHADKVKVIAQAV